MFLIKRPLLLIVTVVASTAWIGFLWSAAIRNGKTPELLLTVGIGLLCGAGTAVLTVLPGFFVYRYFYTQPPEFVADAGEEVLFSDAANHFLDGEGRGGKLFVTDRRLAFCPHRYNVQLDFWSATWDALRGFVASPPFLIVELGDRRVRLVAHQLDKLAAFLERLRGLPVSERAAAAHQARAELGLHAIGFGRAAL